MSLLKLPRNRHIQVGDVLFDARYSQADNTVTLQRDFAWSAPHYLCSAEDFQAAGADDEESDDGAASGSAPSSRSSPSD